MVHRMMNYKNNKYLRSQTFNKSYLRSLRYIRMRNLVMPKTPSLLMQKLTYRFKREQRLHIFKGVRSQVTTTFKQGLQSLWQWQVKMAQLDKYQNSCSKIKSKHNYRVMVSSKTTLVHQSPQSSISHSFFQTTRLTTS